MDFEMSSVSFFFFFFFFPSLSPMKKDKEKKPHANEKETFYMGKQWT